MKKLVLILAGGLLLGSCGSDEANSENESGDNATETQVTESGDVIEDQIMALIADVEKGLKPLSPIAEISKYDNNVKPYLVGENETGNFNSESEKGDYEFSRFYSKKYNDETLLGEIRLSIFVKEDVVWDPETDEEDTSKKIDLDKYKEIITAEMGTEPEEEDYVGGGLLWKTPTANWKLSNYDDYSLEFKVKEAK